MEFEEVQSLKIWWLYLITALSIFPTLAVIIFSKNGPGIEELKRLYFAPLLLCFFPIMVVYLLHKVRFTYCINQNGVFVTNFPLIIKSRSYSWNEIEKIYVKNYDAISEYGGYGIKTRLWFNLKDKAYIFSDGSKGLQIEFKNGRKVLFSTNKLADLTQFLSNLKSKYNIKAIEK